MTPTPAELDALTRGPRHPEGCATCAKPRTAAGRKLLSQFHGWPARQEYPWNLLDANDIRRIEAEAAARSGLDVELLREALALLERGRSLDARALLRRRLGHLPSRSSTALLQPSTEGSDR